jgi:hypothetical protein
MSYMSKNYYEGKDNRLNGHISVMCTVMFIQDTNINIIIIPD